jgi:hypothetical protein
LVEFADFRPLPNGMVGHPRGLEWFCDLHLPAARGLAHLLSGEAMQRLEEHFGTFPPYEPGSWKAAELWLVNVGPRRAAVFAQVRAAMSLPPLEAKERMEQECFRLLSGDRATLEPWRERFELAGATVEVRFP